MKDKWGRTESTEPTREVRQYNSSVVFAKAIAYVTGRTGLQLAVNKLLIANLVFSN